jgi:hypothetical protein
MKKIFMIYVMLGITLLCEAQSPATFKHPGIFSSQAQLDFIKNTVALNNGSPIISGYQTLANDSKGSLTYNPEPYAVVDVVASGSSPAEAAFRRDAHAAYIHAIKWVVTGNISHRNKSVQILNAWANTFQSLSTAPDKPNQPTLEASWALPIWLAGAEIIKTYNNGSAGWASTEVSKFESYVRKIMNYVNGPIASAPNWYISKGLSLLAAGVYLNDGSIYNSGYNIIIPQLDAITTSGQIPELTRDFVHSQYVLIGLAQAAEVAFQQGNNALFTRTNGAAQPRLLLGTEHYTRCLMGTNTPNYQTDSQWARKSAPYEILLLRYNQLGMSVPNTQNYVVNQNRTENGIEDHFLGWLTATHAELPKTNALPSVSITSPGNGATYNTGATVTINATASDGDGSITKVEFFVDGVKIGEDLNSAYTFNWTATKGTHTITVKATDNASGSTTSTAVSITVTSSTQSPYNGSPFSIPGKVEAEQYDFGGQDIAFNDLTAGNTGNVFRTDNVDIQATTDTGGGYAIGWIAAGEWLEYSVNINTPGAYTLTARVSATSDGRSFHVELDGQNISGTVSVTNTGSYQTYATVTVTTPSLTTGQKTLRIVMETPSFNINYLNFASNTSSSNIALNKSATASSVEATGFEVSKAVDGNATTRWSSAFTDAQWLQVDLGANYNINRVKITWEAAYASAYQILISPDGSSWTNMRSVSGNTTLINDQTGLSGTGRYIRINGITRATVYGYSIFELEVYGNLVSARSVNEDISTDNRVEDLKINTFPNPTTESVTVHMSSFWIDGKISLLDTMGKPLFLESIKKTEHTFEMLNSPVGLYIVKVSKDGRTSSQKVIKK